MILNIHKLLSEMECYRIKFMPNTVIDFNYKTHECGEQLSAPKINVIHHRGQNDLSPVEELARQIYMQRAELILKAAAAQMNDVKELNLICSDCPERLN